MILFLIHLTATDLTNEQYFNKLFDFIEEKDRTNLEDSINTDDKFESQNEYLVGYLLDNKNVDIAKIFMQKGVIPHYISLITIEDKDFTSILGNIDEEKLKDNSKKLLNGFMGYYTMANDKEKTKIEDRISKLESKGLEINQILDNVEYNKLLDDIRSRLVDQITR